MKQGWKLLLLVLTFSLWAGKADACKPQIAWGASVSFCQGNSFTLSAYNANSSYLWSNGATTASLTISTSGTYWVSVTNQCGTTSDTIQVIVDQPLTPNLGADRKICGSSVTKLSVPISPSALYQWSTGSTSNSINVSQSGTYWVEVQNACGSFSDTVTLTAETLPPINLGADIVTCNQAPISLNLPSNLSGLIQWSDGSSGHSLSVSTSGSYWVTVSNACGTVSDTIDILYLSAQNLLAHDTLKLCAGGSLSLQTTVAASSYSWSTGSNNASISVNQAGMYHLTANTSCGTLSDTVYVVNSAQPVVDLGPDTVICASDIFRLNAQNAGSTYLWNTGSTAQRLRVSTSGLYWVGVSHGCGYVYDSVYVTVNPTPAPAIADTIYICGSTPDTLDAGNWGPAVSYLWSDGSTGQINQSLTAGNHWLRISGPCDTVVENFSVVSQSLPSFQLNDTSICANSYTLRTHIQAHGHSFLWSNGSQANELRVRQPGTYWVSVSNSCGTVTDTIAVNVFQLPSGIREDTVYMCAGDSVALNAQFRHTVSYQWSNGDTTLSTWISSPGSYTLSSYNQCDTVTDVAYVIQQNPISFSLGNDTTICRNSSFTIDLSQVAADSIVWNDGSKARQRNIGHGTFIATAYNACGSFSDTLLVNKINGVVPVLQDTTFCAGSQLTLDASFGANNKYFLWSTGDTTASIQVNLPGWYSVQISNDCFTTKDSCLVTMGLPLGSIDLGNDTVFCAGALTLDPGAVPNARYLWHNGSTQQTFTATKTGTYYVTVFNACGSVSDTIDVEVTGPPKLTLGSQVKFCRGSALNLNAQNPYCQYQWSTGDTSQSITISTAGRYWVTITNDCGTLTDSVDVIVEDPLTHLDLGKDTIICQGDSILLNTMITGVQTKWGTGSFTNRIYVKTTGDYWVEVSNSCGSVSDTIHVEVLDVPVYSLGTDRRICAVDGEMTLRGPEDYDAYLWSTGDTTADIDITQAGTYWLTVFNRCFAFTDTLEVIEEYPLDIDLGRDTVLCEGQPLYLHVDGAGNTVLWEDGTTGEQRLLSTSGTYWVQVINSCGIFGDTIQVTFDKAPNTEMEQQQVCHRDTATFRVEQGQFDFEWFDGSRQRQRSFVKEGVYPVYFTNSCGRFEKQFVLDVSNCDCPFYTANAFTPNGDGINDVYSVGHSCDLEQFTLRIFNRWGNMVFESEQAEEGWDGSFQGQPLPAGVYTYSIMYSWKVYGERHLRTKTGVINLMR